MNCVGVLSLFFLPTCLFALPSDPSVLAGSADFDIQSNKFLIESADKTIINWQVFSVGEDELARFILPDSKAAVLNRVIGSETSSLLGTLASNGQVYLINPNGILVGPNGRIDTASFIAATLDLSDENFLAGGALLFKGGSQASIVNLGTIHAWDGDAFLIGYQIDNQGELNVPNGLAGIAAGKEVLIKPSGEERIFVCAQVPEGTRSEKGVDHSGVIQAISSEIKADGNLYALAINFTGKAEATGAEFRNGKVFLVADQGYTEFQGRAIAHNADGTGGEVHILGDTIHLADSALIDVSGDFGGGTALIGGNYQGKDTPGPTANRTYVEKNAEVHADALLAGDGGLAVFWSDNEIVHLGKAYARGGEVSGNGGKIEVSSKGGYLFEGYASTLAPNGKAGMLLLDPLDITISSAPNSTVTGATPFTPLGPICNGNPGFNNLNTGTLNTALGLGNATVQTAGTAGGCNGDILVASSFIRVDANTLTLDAAGNITFNAAITGSGSTTLISGDGAAGSITFNSSLTTTSGDIAMTTTSGDIDILPTVAAGAVEVSSASQAVSGITITFNTTGSLNIGNSASNFSAQLGSSATNANCDLSILQTTTTGASNINVTAGSTAGAYAQIGHSGSGTLAGNISSNSPLDTTATSINVLGGSATGAYALIGHNNGASMSGEIELINNDGNMTLQGGSATGTYAQIGFAPSTTFATSIDGSILIPNLTTISQTLNLSITGGTASGAYGLIGMGGQVTPLLTLSNPTRVLITVDVYAIGVMTLTGGSAADTYAAIGVTGASNVTFNPPGTSGPAFKIFVEGDGNTVLQSGTGPFTSGAYVGYFFYDGVGTITVPPSPNNFMEVEVVSNNNLTITSSPGVPPAAAIGIDALHGTIGDIGIDLVLAGDLIAFTDNMSTNPTGGAFAQDGIGNPLNHSTSTTTEFFGSGLTITSSTTSSAYINATGTLFGFELGDVTMTGTPAFPAYINAPNGNVSDVDLVMSDNAYINVPTTGGGLLTWLSFFNTSITDNSYILSQSATGSLTLVIDAFFPTPPSVGPSTFTLDNTSSISLVSGNQLRIYTATPLQNTIQGLLNGVPFTGTPFVNDNQNEYDTYYPAGGFDQAFPFYRIYYKVPGTTLPTAAQAIQIAAFEGVPDLQLYDQMEVWTQPFSISYNANLTPLPLLSKTKKTLSKERVSASDFLSSQQVIGTEYYFERYKKHLMNQDPL